MNLYSAKEMTLLLERHGFFFKKNMGQNFLMNENTAQRIARSSFETLPSEKKKVAIEIGPGAGSLTLPLSGLFDKVLALELDPHLIPVLKESLSDCNNVDVLNTDALLFDYENLTERYPDYAIAVCSNLPYYITSQIIMRLLESKVPISSLTLLIQKEAAKRLASAPGSEDYGAITAAVSYHAKAETLFSVGPGNFIPRPKVDSTVLRLIPYKTPPVCVRSEAMLFSVIRASFSARRKTIANALFQIFSTRLSKEEIQERLRNASLDPNRRGETMTLVEFAKIADIFTDFEEC